MAVNADSPDLPTGGVQIGRGQVRAWRWSAADAPLTEPQRCRREQWYLARAVAHGPVKGRPTLRVRFLARDEPLAEHCIRLERIAGRNGAAPLCGWIQSPPQATHFQLELPVGNGAAALGEVVLREVAERDPKCHPAANVPRWTTYQPPFPLERLVLPAGLAGLAEIAPQRQIDVLPGPRSMRQLAARCMGAAVILDPGWVQSLSITPHRLAQLASIAYVLIDLDAFVGVLRRAGQRGVECRCSRAADEIMSARVVYADLATRGFALEDAFPFATIDERGRYVTRAITMNRAWKCYADAHDLAPLLASETPWVARSGDVLAAVRAVGNGELLVTDAPWVVSGTFGPNLAPRLAAHVLRMQLGGPLTDDVQYWNRWDETHIVVRDLLELARRYPPLRPQRWNSNQPGLARLGLTLPAREAARRHLVVRTGRIDNLEPHDGLAPESAAIFMKWLAREAREGTAWARRHLDRTSVTLQFDTRAGLRYAHAYEAAPEHRAGHAHDQLTVRCVAPGRAGRATSAEPVAGGARGGRTDAIVDDVGLFGDGSHAFQMRLSRLLRAAIESAGGR